MEEQHHQISFEEAISEMKKHEKEKSKDILDILLDEDNCDPIMLVDEAGKRIAFEQVAIIPHEKDNKRYLYAILKPIDKIHGINDDEAVVFYMDEIETGIPVLKVEADEKIAIEVFGEYYRLLDEARRQDDTNKKIAEFIRQLSKKRKGGKK